MKVNRPLSIHGPSFRYGIYLAAQLASEYDRSSTHPYRLGDCILAKMNLLKKGRVRKNTVGARIEAVLLRLERKVASLEGAVRFMTRRAKEGKITE